MRLHLRNSLIGLGGILLGVVLQPVDLLLAAAVAAACFVVAVSLELPARWRRIRRREPLTPIRRHTRRFLTGDNPRPPRSSNATHSAVPRHWRLDIHRQTVGNRWEIVSLEDEWIETSSGATLAARIRLRNLTDCEMATPRFSIDSGAKDANPKRDADCDMWAEGRRPLPPSIGAGSNAEGWLIAAFKPRFDGGWPGYRIVSTDIDGNWRGHEIDAIEPTPGAAVLRAEAWEIAGELSRCLEGSRWILDEILSTEDMYQRRADAWNRDLGGHESAMAQLFRRPTEQYVEWAQSTTAYLRDRIGGVYASQFAAVGESGTVRERLERHSRLVEQFLGEFRAMPTR